MQNLLFGGATLVKSTDVLAHANNPTALTGDVSGLVGVGVASAIGKKTMDMAFYRKRAIRRHKYKKK